MTRREFEVTDPEEIMTILRESKLLHLGLVDKGMPYVVPMNYGFSMEDGKLTLYLHSANRGYKLDVIRSDPRCCFTMESEIAPFRGKVACQYGVAYRCLMGRGKVSIVENPEEKMRAMALLMKTQTGEDFAFDERMVSIVTVIRVDVDSYTAKHRPTPEEMKQMM